MLVVSETTLARGGLRYAMPELTLSSPSVMVATSQELPPAFSCLALHEPHNLSPQLTSPSCAWLLGCDPTVET